MRRLLLIVALVVAGLALPAVGAMAANGDSAAQQAADAIAAAQQQANDAAQAWEEAKADLDRMSDEEAQLQADQTDLQARVDDLSTTVQQVAINRFVAGSTSGVPLLSGLSGPNDQAQAEVLLGVVNDSSAAQLNDYAVAKDELEDKSKDLAAAQAKTRKAQEQLEAAQANALAQVEHLKEVEEQRLKDEAIAKEVARIQAAKRAQEAAEQAARDQAAAQAAAVMTASAVPQAAGPARGGGGTDDSTTTAPQAPSTTAPASSDDNDNGDNGDNGGETPAATTSPATQAPATTSPPDDSDDGGSDGSYNDGSIVCPAPGAAFGDTWGAARSGGRRHEGVDMIGSLGMPLYAVVSGTVQFKQTSLGGNSAWVNGNNGNRYFYAHIDSFVGESRSVEQGELIAYMGHTGNANGVNHLHFEVHPGGGAAVNPYPSVRAAC